METKTISQLNTKAWYRLVKVIYITFFVIIFLLCNLILFNSFNQFKKTLVQYTDGTKIEFDSEPNQQDIEDAYNQAKHLPTSSAPDMPISVAKITTSYIEFFKWFIIWNFLSVLLYILIRGAFYYVILGKFKPEKNI